MIDENSGDVWANVTFDYETKNRYVLIVAACDRGNPPQCSEVEFTVAVQDANDECPYFDLEHVSQTRKLIAYARFIRSLGVS